jgi:hypothetical protein
MPLSARHAGPQNIVVSRFSASFSWWESAPAGFSVHARPVPPRFATPGDAVGSFDAVREYSREGSFMLDRHIDILQRLRTLSTELIGVSGRDTSSLTDEEIEALTRRLEEIRAEIAELREKFKETLN